ncbi:MAG: hypothetical protein ABJF10_23510 [Chthoniobacter sp.]|uniref:hypothetical protein n=1 Tax=Chthoniobacter sp. TaxID=2510640 RepID=UPI0032A5185F
MKIRQIIAPLAAFLAAVQVQASPWVIGESTRSPDQAGRVLVQYRDRSAASEWHITLSKNGRILHRRLLPDKLDVRYVRASWSPSSCAVLLGENYKDGMDLTLLRITGRHVISTHLDLARRISEKEEKELPFRREFQSHAPVKRVTWSTVRWISPTRCQMLYILHGLGYEGESDVTVDFTGRRPSLKTSRLRALTHPENFSLD